MSASFYWHDYETFGIDSRRDRPAQFAGQRTTLELEPIGEPLSIYCKPAPDVLPQPVSCLITGITPQLAEREGAIEAEFAARLHDELALPGTCGAGYNSIRFDDEFTRNLLYRNFYDPYEREWKDGNSRWDIIDLARMCYALRPDGIEWPKREREGTASASKVEVPSFRLEDLTRANRLSHDRAHDALSDVHATIALARLLRSRQPRLWDFYLSLRKKQRVIELLDWAHRAPVLHVSSRYVAERGCLAMVVPLAVHPQQQNKVIVYDLDIDPTPLIELDADDIADRVFTARADLPDDVARIPLKAVSINKSPGLAPLSVLKGADPKRIGLDVDRCNRHLQQLQRAANVAEKCRRVFAGARDETPQQPDAELAIYGGFASDADKRRCSEVRRTPLAELGSRDFGFHDARFAELLFRYRARNWPETLTSDEQARWKEFAHARLTRSTPLTSLTLEQFFAEIAALRSNPATTGAQLVVLDQLADWGRRIAAESTSGSVAS